MSYTRRGTPLKERLEFYSAPPDKNGCRRWLSSCREPGGYGQLQYGGKSQIASRLVLEHKLGRRLKRTLCALHTCDHPWCVAEDHLYEGSKKQNAHDRESRGRGNQPKGERHRKAKITLADARAIKKMDGSHAEIGRKYGLKAPAVWKIKQGINWP